MNEFKVNYKRILASKKSYFILYQQKEDEFNNNILDLNNKHSLLCSEYNELKLSLDVSMVITE